MDEKKANIDLVFRNGLKDYEVLPPPEVWNNIRPAVRKKQLPLVILRTAAAVAVLLSLTFLAYRMSRQINGSFENNLITLNDESDSRQTTPVPRNLTPLQNFLTPSDASTAERNRDIQTYFPEDSEQDVPSAGKDPDPVQNVTYLAGSDNISVSEKTARTADLLLLFETTDTKIKTEDPAILLAPGILPEKKTEKWSIGALVSPTYHTNFYPGNDEASSRLGDDEQCRQHPEPCASLRFEQTGRRVRGGPHGVEYPSFVTGLAKEHVPVFKSKAHAVKLRALRDHPVVEWTTVSGCLLLAVLQSPKTRNTAICGTGSSAVAGGSAPPGGRATYPFGVRRFIAAFPLRSR